MAKGRMIKKVISKSKKMGALKCDASRLLYMMMMPHSDIKGRLEGDPLLVRNTVIPYFSDWDDDKTHNCLNDLHNFGLIQLYEVKGEQYIQITRFEDFQTLRKDREAESEIPDPPKLQINSNQTPALSKVKLSKDKLNKESGPTTCVKPVDNSPQEPSADSKELEELKMKVYQEKQCNVHMFINRFKKDQRDRKALYIIPDSVYIEVCKTILGLSTAPKEWYPYFMHILTLKADEWNANRNIDEHEAIKKEPTRVTFPTI